MSVWGWLLAGVALLGLGGVLYWQLIIAEGAYLGARVVALTYDLVARRYDHIKQYDANFETSFLGRPLARALENVRAPYVLDVGTGTGRLPLALFEQPTFQGRVVALDASRRMLRVAAGKLAAHRHRIDLLWMQAARLPFPDATFDAVTCLEVLEFLPDEAAQLYELARVLRAGGVLVTTRRRGLDARLMPGKTHSREAFVNLLASSGLRDVEVLRWQQDYDLVWALRSGEVMAGQGGARRLVEVMRCSRCGRQALRREEDGLMCGACGARAAIQDGVVQWQRAR